MQTYIKLKLKVPSFFSDHKKSKRVCNRRVAGQSAKKRVRKRKRKKSNQLRSRLQLQGQQEDMHPRGPVPHRLAC